jgi:tRNA-splicing ligase RtcB
MKLDVIEQFTTIHNYIDTEMMILRKGSVSARKGEKFIIPINMRDGSLLCVGKGNEDWNYSAPHGAGRLMSRTKTKQKFTVSEFKKQMKEVYSSTVNKGTLDECPMAYKNIDDILKNIGPTADVMKIIKPIYNFKAK